MMRVGFTGKGYIIFFGRESAFARFGVSHFLPCTGARSSLLHNTEDSRSENAFPSNSLTPIAHNACQCLDPGSIDEKASDTA